MESDSTASDHGEPNLRSEHFTGKRAVSRKKKYRPTRLKFSYRAVKYVFCASRGNVGYSTIGLVIAISTNARTLIKGRKVVMIELHSTLELQAMPKLVLHLLAYVIASLKLNILSTEPNRMYLNDQSHAV